LCASCSFSKGKMKICGEWNFVPLHLLLGRDDTTSQGIDDLPSLSTLVVSGTLISVLIRIELYSSGNRIISPENQNFYNISITLHGFLMIFFLSNARLVWRIWKLFCCYLSRVSRSGIS
jgi:hypothetical protein